jgi:cobaltochelatase CobS
MATLRHKDFVAIKKIIQAGQPPYLPGPAGAGKTTLAKQIADDLGLPFYFTGAVDSPFQLKGFIDAQGQPVHTPFRQAYQNGGLFLFDEMDGSDPAAIVAMHAALDNGILDAPDGIIRKHRHFRFIAAANTFGRGATLDYVGRNPLDGASIDRYVFHPIDYDKNLERAIVKAKYPHHVDWVDVVHKARHVVEQLKIRQIVSTRACVQGAALLQAGFRAHRVFRMTVGKSLPDDEILTIWNGVERTTLEEVQNAYRGDQNDSRLGQSILSAFWSAKALDDRMALDKEEIRNALSGDRPKNRLYISAALRLLQLAGQT